MRASARWIRMSIVAAALPGCGARSSLPLPTLEAQQTERCRVSCDDKRAGDDDGCGGVCEAVLFGGSPGSQDDLGNGAPIGDTWTFDGAAWKRLAAKGPSPRASFAIATLGRNVVVFGGAGPNPPALGDTWTLAEDVWSQSSTSGPPPRVQAAMANLHGALILEGGGDGLSDGPPFSDCWRWDGSTWEELDDGPVRAEAAMAPLGDDLVLFGGADATHTVTSDTWIFHDEAWTKLDVPGPPARADAALAPVAGKLILFGGFGEESVLGDTWSFDGEHWTALAPSSSPTDVVLGPRVAPAMTSLFGDAIRFGGCSSIFADDATVFADTLALRDGAWSDLDVHGPEGRCYAGLVTR